VFHNNKVGIWDLLSTVAAGGTISLTGPRFHNADSYNPKTFKSIFMARERNLVDALMDIVFSKEGNVWRCMMTQVLRSAIRRVCWLKLSSQHSFFGTHFFGFPAP
jgi:hypothetical protein